MSAIPSKRTVRVWSEHERKNKRIERLFRLNLAGSKSTARRAHRMFARSFRQYPRKAPKDIVSFAHWFW